jgi:SAM-dependent methyltransferase
MTTTLHPDKRQAIQQWTHDPCGGVEGLDPHDVAYWRQVDYERYDRYAPWMADVFGFNRYGGKRVLEVGFGLGTDLMQFARGGSRVFGIDLTPNHVELAGLRFRTCGMKAGLLRGDAEQLPFDSDSFDLVYSFGVLHHTPDMPQALREIHRVLKPGGRLLLTVYHRYSVWMAWRIAVDGVMKGELLRDGWRTMMSRVERRTDPSSASPLVRVYSRRQLRGLLRGFREVTLSTHHPGFSVPSKEEVRSSIKRLVVRVLSDAALQPRFGWYLVATATK